MIKLGEKRRELEGVVGGMTNTFMAFSDSLLKCRNTNPEMTRGPNETMKKFLALLEKAPRDPWGENDVLPEHSDEKSIPEVVVEDTASSSMPLNPESCLLSPLKPPQYFSIQVGLCKLHSSTDKKPQTSIPMPTTTSGVSPHNPNPCKAQA